MRQPNYARAVALCLGPCLALACASSWAGRAVQDGLLMDGVPPIEAKYPTGLKQYSDGSEARVLDWTSKGALLVAVHEAGQDRLFKIAGAPPAPEPLGAAGGRVLSAAAQAFHEDWIAYLGSGTSAAGGEGASLSLRALSGDQEKSLVPASARPGAPVWAHDGHRLAFTASLRDGKSRDVFVLDTSDASGPRLVASGTTDAREVLAWTSADRALLVRHALASGGDELLLVDVESGAARRVDSPSNVASHAHIGDARLAPDDRAVYYLSDAGSDRPTLRYTDLYDGSSQELTAALSHAMDHFDVSADGHLIALSWTEFGYSRVALLDRSSKELTPLPNMPPGAVTALRFDQAGKQLAFELAANAAPRDVYVFDLASKVSTRWTESRLGEYTAARLIAPLTIRFPSWDRPSGSGSALTALYYRPRSAGPYPVLIMLNGAGAPPSAQLDPFVQYCVNELGLALIAPSVREGESGVVDLGALIAWIGAQPDLKRDRIMVQGRGSGGTLALAALGMYGDRLRAAVSIDGMAAGPQVMPIRRPVLLVQGLDDQVLDAASAEQLLWRMRRAKINSWFVAPRDMRASLASDAERSSAQAVIAQFIAAQLGP